MINRNRVRGYLCAYMYICFIYQYNIYFLLIYGISQSFSNIKINIFQEYKIVLSGFDLPQPFKNMAKNIYFGGMFFFFYHFDFRMGFKSLHRLSVGFVTSL